MSRLRNRNVRVFGWLAFCAAKPGSNRLALLDKPAVAPARTKAKRGLSYLEVLIAAGIALTGILGAVALYPVASLNMQKGQVADAAAYIGPSVLEGGSAVGATTRSRWIAHNGTNWSVTASSLMGQPNVGTDLRTVSGPWASICIDPRFCAEVTNANSNVVSRFPYVATTSNNDVRMLRCTLSTTPGSTTAMGIAQSRLLFKVSDDILFNKPNDLTVPAAQNYLLNDSDVAQRRDYFANFEYIITLTPGLTGVPTYATTGQAHYDGGYISGAPAETTPFQQTNQYLMSVVVLHQRQPRLADILPGTATAAEAERVLNVVKTVDDPATSANPDFTMSGINGGEVFVQTRDASRPATDLLLHEGDWVMLSGMMYAKGTEGTRKLLGPLFQWYKVTGLEAEYRESGGIYGKYVTLEGPDWPVDLMDDGNNGPIQMTIVSGAVGVYQQTVTVTN